MVAGSGNRWGGRSSDPGWAPARTGCLRGRGADECRNPGAPLTRLAFLGTPLEAAQCLEALSRAGHEIAVVVTRPDSRAGRGHRTVTSPVREAARELGLVVSERTSDAVASGAELGVVVAYGRMIPASVLDQLPMVNVHFSLLPRWRGAAPVEWAILEGDAAAGVSLMALDEGLDTGDVYEMRAVGIERDDTAATLRSKLTTLGIEMLLERLAGGVASLGEPRPQVGDATYARKIVPDMLRLDWSHGAEQLDRVVRVGGAWTMFRGRRLKVHEANLWHVALPGTGDQAPDSAIAADLVTVSRPGSIVPIGAPRAVLVACGDGFLELATVQAEGRKPMTGVQWWLGARPRPSDLLG